jgi:hypothetical protein
VPSMEQWYEILIAYALHETDLAQDKLELLTNPKTPVPVTMRFHEVKSTLHESLTPLKREAAIFQTSLYMVFLRRMLSKDTPFDFDAYFRFRGLNPRQAFDPKFASAFSKLQHKLFNPLGSPPRDLQQLAEQWNRYIQCLPTFKIENRVWITTIRPGRISPVGGFGQNVDLTIESYPSQETEALKVAKSVVDLLDGRRQPRGVDSGKENICINCSYNHKCPWRPDLHAPYRNVRPLVSPIRDYGVKVPVEIARLPAALVGNATSSEGSSSIPSGSPQPNR